MGDRGDLIVVGVDASAGSAAALDFALAEGWKRACPVEVVTAWLGGRADGTTAAEDLTDGRKRVQRVQDEVVARCLEQCSEVPDLVRIVVHDYAGRVLVSRAEWASMLVVGGGSPSSGSPQVLGSVAEYSVRHSPAPVVIVPTPDRIRRRAADQLGSSRSG